MKDEEKKEEKKVVKKEPEKAAEPKKTTEPAKKIGYSYKNGKYITDDGLAFKTQVQANDYCKNKNKK